MRNHVILIPEKNAHALRLRASIRHDGASCSGRTWLYPDGRTVTYATPNQRPMELPYTLTLEGWGHKLTPREATQIGQWRRDAR